MPGLITQVCNGVPHGQIFKSNTNTLDNGNSEIFVQSFCVYE